MALSRDNRLHHELQPKLNPARISRRGNLTNSERIQRSVGLPEGRRVGEVETFDAKLQVLSLRDAEVFRQRKIQITQSGTKQNIASGIAVGKLRLNHEG